MLKSKNKYSRLLFLITLAWLFLPGCCQYKKRQEWLTPKYQVYFELNSNEKVTLNKEFLVNRLGSPDYVISPHEFKKRLSLGKDYSEKVIKRLMESYSSSKDTVRDNVNSYQTFEFDKDTMLWLYDESIHFEKPVKPPIFTMCADTGFSCFCFYVEEGKVLDGVIFNFWKPLKPAK